MSVIRVPSDGLRLFLPVVTGWLIITIHRFDRQPHMDKQLAGLSILMTIVWVSAVLLVMYWMSH